MTDEQTRAFLGDGTRTAKLATVRKDGRPHVTPIWFVVDDDGALMFTTSATSRKGKAILRDPAVCLCIDDDIPPFGFVMIDGTADTIEDPEALLAWATRIGGRYMGADKAERYGRRNGAPGELLVRVTPVRVVAERRVAE